MFSITNTLQHLSRKDDDLCLNRLGRECQHWRQSNFHYPIPRRYRWNRQKEKKMLKDRFIIVCPQNNNTKINK